MQSGRDGSGSGVIDALLQLAPASSVGFNEIEGRVADGGRVNKVC